MKNTPLQPDLMKRKLLTLLASLPLFTACSANSSNLSTDPEDVRLRKKFRGIYGVVLKLDATSPKHGVTLTNEKGRIISADATLGPHNVANLTYTDNSMSIPKAVRATWREGKFKSVYGGGWKDGTIIGDYTVPVAERIPDSILDYIRKNGGALRLKIRLKDDGILIGWDVERSIPIPNCVKTPIETCFQLEYFMAGGDFQQAKIFNGEVVRKGWCIDKNGQKIETDY